MATAEQEIDTDPITAALPPNSDYITYLTILEYRLTPDGLPTLTKHLAEDDGTLAKEIGWDLVKLILPFVDVAPDNAAKCLEVVARRGNPREVVVRVAEALETLEADDDDAAESGFDEDVGTDELPTFEGEAQRIHLGQMKLEGMPPYSPKKQPSSAAQLDEEQHNTSATSSSLSQRFSALLSILALLHTRIKTQYPSRFLATSLPAALGAYRRIPITPETTDAFVDLLGKMSGKQRPTLPPRSSTASVTQLKNAATPVTEIYAPLPDPEGWSEENAKAPSDLEKSIVLRLLQAVSLEVLEEHLLADQSTMEWSTRLLEKQSPSKAIPDRMLRSKVWHDDKVLQSKDSMMEKFLRLAKDLHLNPEAVFWSTNLPLLRDQDSEEVIADTSGEKADDEEPSEFPTSPSQIPYSHLGALFLFLASKIPALVHSDEKVSSLDFSAPDLHHFVNQFVVPTPTLLMDQFIPSVAHNQPTAIDALLSLLLLTLPLQSSAISVSQSSGDADYRSLIAILSYLSAEHPNPAFRATAHRIATALLHNHPSSALRLATIKSTITDCGPFENLKEVAISWLKEEILFTIPDTSNAASSIRGIEDAQAKPSSKGEDNNIFALPTLFSDDETLSSLIFQTTSPPLMESSSSTDDPTTLPPANAIASLNLLFLLLKNPTLKSRYNLASKLTSLQSSPAPPTTTDTTTFESKALKFLTTLQAHVTDNAGLGSKEEEGKLGLLGLAVGRVVGALEGFERERKREEERKEEMGRE